jgi:hypothetical protein
MLKKTPRRGRGYGTRHREHDGLSEQETADQEIEQLGIVLVGAAPVLGGISGDDRFRDHNPVLYFLKSNDEHTIPCPAAVQE